MHRPVRHNNQDLTSRPHPLSSYGRPQQRALARGTSTRERSNANLGRYARHTLGGHNCAASVSAGQIYRRRTRHQRRGGCGSGQGEGKRWMAQPAVRPRVTTRTRRLDLSTPSSVGTAEGEWPARRTGTVCWRWATVPRPRLVAGLELVVWRQKNAMGHGRQEGEVEAKVEVEDRCRGWGWEETRRKRRRDERRTSGGKERSSRGRQE